MSFRAILPWSTCGNWWNTEACSVSAKMAGNESLLATINGTLVAYDDYKYNLTSDVVNNITNASLEAAKRVSPSEEYWQ